MRTVSGFILTAMMLVALVPARAVSTAIDLTPFANRNIQQALYPDFPTGHVVPPKNSFGEPFNIPAGVKNFVVLDKETSPVTLHVGVPGVRKVYTLMQAFGPWRGAPICTVEFVGSGGGTQTFTLVGGQNIRDFFESGFTRSINNNTTQNAFEFIGRGGAYTDDVTNGPRGFYIFDEQEFVLGERFANETLDSIIFTASGQGGIPILLGVTVETSLERKTSLFSGNNLYYGGLIAGLVLFIGAIVWLRARGR